MQHGADNYSISSLLVRSVTYEVGQCIAQY